VERDPGPERPEARASDAEREQAVERLSAAAAKGRLTYEELTARTGQAYRARTRGELESVTRDLPAAPSPPVTPSRWLVAVFGDERLGGRWAAPARLTVVALFGDVTVDLRGAEVRVGEVAIHAAAVFGDVHVIVPRGATVELSGVAVFGNKRAALEPADRTLPRPVVRVIASAVVGDVVVANQPPRSLMKSAKARWKKGGTGDST
jgi:uncharacterized protein DUF1707/cell wall-active antibiotic response 4TMS protein YvqF